MSRTRELDNEMFVMDVGFRNEEPIALIERTFKNGTKEYTDYRIGRKRTKEYSRTY